jgi:hypothetical protein
LVANKLLPEIALAPEIERFATEELNKLTVGRPTKRVKTEPSATPLIEAPPETQEVGSIRHYRLLLLHNPSYVLHAKLVAINATSCTVNWLLSPSQQPQSQQRKYAERRAGEYAF